MALPSLFFFYIEAMKRNSILVLPSKQRLHKLCFLQKLGCQKPCWDQTRLSSLVNKQVAFRQVHNSGRHQRHGLSLWFQPCPRRPKAESCGHYAGAGDHPHDDLPTTESAQIPSWTLSPGEDVLYWGLQEKCPQL